jgi:hypothetical protein
MLPLRDPGQLIRIAKPSRLLNSLFITLDLFASLFLQGLIHSRGSSSLPAESTRAFSQRKVPHGVLSHSRDNRNVLLIIKRSWRKRHIGHPCQPAVRTVQERQTRVTPLKRSLTIYQGQEWFNAENWIFIIVIDIYCITNNCNRLCLVWGVTNIRCAIVYSYICCNSWARHSTIVTSLSLI